MYETFYKLTARPFQTSPDPRFFFSSQGHKRALAYLRYGLRQGEGFVIITGEVGAGKSMLIQTLLRSLHKKGKVVAAQLVSTQMHADDLLRSIAAAFGLPYENIPKAVLLCNLEGFFKDCFQQGKPILLIVDEAQNLPPASLEELRMLSNFQIGGKTLFQSFLLGQREFRYTLRGKEFEQLRQRVIAAYHLKPLEEEETRAYIEHRLQRAGWLGVPGFTEETYRGIHQYTAGIPRRINILCDRLLLFGCLEKLQKFDVSSLAVVTQDILAEQGEEPESVAPAAPLAEDARKILSVPGTTREMYPKEDRIAGIENTMAALLYTMREELALLRKVLQDQKESKSN